MKFVHYDCSGVRMQLEIEKLKTDPDCINITCSVTLERFKRINRSVWYSLLTGSNSLALQACKNPILPFRHLQSALLKEVEKALREVRSGVFKWSKETFSKNSNDDDDEFVIEIEEPITFKHSCEISLRKLDGLKIH